MVTITNGNLTLMVTPGAFRDVYSAQGFKEISNVSHNTQKTLSKAPVTQGGIVSGVDPENASDELPEPLESAPDSKAEKQLSRKEELSEIPLNEMTPEQLREYAKLLGVNLKGLRSKTAVKDKIRSVL